MKPAAIRPRCAPSSVHASRGYRRTRGSRWDGPGGGSSADRGQSGIPDSVLIPAPLSATTPLPFISRGQLLDAACHTLPALPSLNTIAALCFSCRHIEVRPGQRTLDVCVGTNAVGIALLKKEPSLEVHAIDRGPEMLEVGRVRTKALGLSIDGITGDVHELPFPDNHFDIVTSSVRLPASSRGPVPEVFRVLKPGGRFHHCDMLRPGNPVVEKLYFAYLRFCLAFTRRIGQDDIRRDDRLPQRGQAALSPTAAAKLLQETGR